MILFATKGLINIIYVQIMSYLKFAKLSRNVARDVKQVHDSA